MDGSLRGINNFRSTLLSLRKSSRERKIIQSSAYISILKWAYILDGETQRPGATTISILSSLGDGRTILPSAASDVRFYFGIFVVVAVHV